MATLGDIGISAAINILISFIFLLAFAILRLQPMNDRVYFPKWYLKGSRQSPKHVGASIRKFVNLEYRTYFKFLNWIPEALKMPEAELIDHAGLDSVVYLRIYLVGFYSEMCPLIPMSQSVSTLSIFFLSTTLNTISLIRIPETIGVAIPMKATFFITYIMVDGWAGIAGEILRLIPLIIFHLKNMLLVKTEKDKEKAMDPGSVPFAESLPRLQLYFLLGLVYVVVTPILRIIFVLCAS